MSAQRPANAPSAPRRAGLQDHRTALRRARHGQRAAHGEVLALVVDLVHLGRVGELAGLPVHDQRAVLPGVPQRRDGLQELLGPVVALVVVQMGLDAEVLRLRVVHRGDDVPRGPPAGQVVERGERAGDVERVVVRRGVGGADADPRRGADDPAEHGRQVELDRAGAVADGVGDRVAVDAGHGEPVVEEHAVELRRLQRLRDVRVVVHRQEPEVGRRVAPRSGVDGHVAGLHEADQRHLSGHESSCPREAEQVGGCRDGRGVAQVGGVDEHPVEPGGAQPVRLGVPVGGARRGGRARSRPGSGRTPRSRSPPGDGWMAHLPGVAHGRRAGRTAVR